MRYYDKSHNRLIYIEQKATPEYWDQQWEDAQLKKTILSGANDRFVFPTTKKYLPIGSKILEGGCGKGQFVFSLQSRGYSAIGVDFAKETVTKVMSVLPDFPMRLGDVRKLDFPDATFDGYWSLGVIEHFFEGYDSIAEEMCRVLKPDGYLFLTFPYMSPLRKLKVHLKAYPAFTADTDMKNFYQFALDARTVIEHFSRQGFKLVEQRPYEGFKGLKDESGPLKPLLQKIYDNKSLFGKLTSFCFSTIFAPFASHTVLLVLRKKL